MMLMAGGGVVAVGGLAIGGAMAGLSIATFGYAIAQAGTALIKGSPESVVARIRTERNGLVHVRRRHLGETSIGRGPDGSLVLDLRFKNVRATFTGSAAERIASLVVPNENRYGV